MQIRSVPEAGDAAEDGGERGPAGRAKPSAAPRRETLRGRWVTRDTKSARRESAEFARRIRSVPETGDAAVDMRDREDGWVGIPPVTCLRASSGRQRIAGLCQDISSLTHRSSQDHF